ncbi:MAG: TonB-dependent receptor, partial [Alphaproteobacteria bacterium]|nr:TonB-dependent receptor [Alphaproteobacteria bacterium]
ATARAAYTAGVVTFSWQVNYLSNGIGDIDLIGDPDAAPLNSVGDRWYHDTQLRFDLGEDKRYAFYVGADNVFNSKPPFLPGTPFVLSPTGTETAADVYDPFGRRFYVGAQVRF